MSRPTLRLLPAGPTARLVETADTASAVALAEWARARVLATDVVAGERSVLLDGGVVPDLVARLAEWPGPAAPVDSRLVELEVEYDGADLAVVAETWRMSERDVVRTHTALEFMSAFCGFAPGFAYLAGLPAPLAVPRLATPRARVPAGAVGLAARWCGVYPRSSPGGWLLLGTTDAVLWDADAAEPALLAPGTRVRFREAP